MVRGSLPGDLFFSKFLKLTACTAGQLGVERECVILQEFLISGVLWGYLECIHFYEIIMV